MRAELVPIKDCVVKAKTWNPVTEAKDETITYIDIAAVDKDLKIIVEPTICLGSDAPSRARQLVQMNDVLVSTVRPNLNSVAVVTEAFDGATASTGYTVLRPLPHILDTQYLFHWVKTEHFINEMVKLATGQSYPAVSDKIILNSKIPLPPLEEQRRIASILDKADELRQKRQQTIEKLDQLLQATFIDMFGDPVSNPKDWNSCKFENIIEFVTYGLTVRPQYHEEGIPLISAREIRTGELNFDSCPKISKIDFEKLSEKAKPKKNDILFSKTGSIGHCAIVKDSLDFALTQNAARVVPRMDICNPIFLLSFMRTKYFYNLANKEAKGNAVKDLQLGVMKSFLMYLPPKELQDQWAIFAESIEKQKKMLEDSRVDISNLFKSLQNQALSGTL